MATEEQIKLLDEIFGVKDMRHYPQFDELIVEWLEQVDRTTAMQSDPTVVLDILGEVDDMVCHRLRPALWERMDRIKEFDRVEEIEMISEKRTTTRTEKLSGEPAVTRVPGRMVLREIFDTVLSSTIYTSPCVLVGNADCDLDVLYNAYSTVPGLMDSIAHLVLTPEGLDVLLEESDKVLFTFTFNS